MDDHNNNNNNNNYKTIQQINNNDVLPVPVVLEVHVVGARNLKNADLTGKSDPYCKLSLLCHTGGEIFTRKFGETTVIKNNLNPTWNERFQLPLSALQDKNTTYFIIDVYDRDNTNADDLLGSCRVFVHYAEENHIYKDAWHKLVRPSTAEGEIHIELIWRNANKLNDSPINTASIANINSSSNNNIASLIHLDRDFEKRETKFGTLISICPVLAFPSLYFKFEGGTDNNNPSKVFPGDSEVVLDIVEEVNHMGNLGSLYATQYRIVFCPYEDTSVKDIYVKAFSLWYGNISAIDLKYVTNEKHYSKIQYGQDGHRQRLIKTITFTCKDVDTRIFYIKAKENIQSLGIATNSMIVKAAKQRKSLALDPKIWIKAVQMAAQRLVEEVRWRIAERGYAYSLFLSLMGDETNTYRRDLQQCRMKFNSTKEETGETSSSSSIDKINNEFEFDHDKISNGQRRVKLDFARLGILANNSYWKITSENMDFKLCPTYPKLLAIPRSIDTITLKKSAKFRSKNRFVALCWINQKNGACLCRCSQPLTGIIGGHSTADRKVLTAIRNCIDLYGGEDDNTYDNHISGGQNHKVLHVFDARPWINAMGNTIAGKGYENISSLGGEDFAKLNFLGIENIHTVRNSLINVMLTCRKLLDAKNFTAQFNFYSDIGQTQWLQHIFSILHGTSLVTDALEAGHPSIVHCSDGWDRTPQICATTQLLMDSHYRTIHGFATLIEKEWCCFGHQFDRRNSDVNRGSGRDFSPIFLQWLDVVFQVYNQFPHRFEFNENLLIFLSIHVYSGIFGNFLYNNEKEREEENGFESIDIWSFVKENLLYFENLKYQPNETFDMVIKPSKLPSSIVFWRNCYLQSASYDKANESTLMYETSLHNHVQVQQEILQNLKSRIDACQELFGKNNVKYIEQVQHGIGVHKDAVLAIRRKVVQQYRDINRELDSIMPPDCKLELQISFVQVAKEKEQGRKFAQYLLEIHQIEPTPNQWAVYRRVSDFYSLNDYLMENNIIVASGLPAKTWFHSYDAEFLAARMKELNDYCKVIETQTDLFSSSSKHFLHLKNFLTDGLQFVTI